MTIEEMFNYLDELKLEPRYIKKDEHGFSRWIEFNTKYQKCFIEYYINVSTLRIGDMYSVRIPFHRFQKITTSPSNKLCLRFSNKDITPNFGLADHEIDLTLEKLDWQENYHEK